MPHRTTSLHVPNGPSALVKHFVALHVWDAQVIQQRFGVPASVVLAQSGYESGWGTKVIQNAYFGIKGHAPDGNSTTFVTHEYDKQGKRHDMPDKFRAYRDYNEAAIDYANVLRRFYAPAFAHKNNSLDFIKYLSRYATYPHYVKTLENIIKHNNFQQYDTQP